MPRRKAALIALGSLGAVLLLALLWARHKPKPPAEGPGRWEWLRSRVVMQRIRLASREQGRALLVEELARPYARMWRPPSAPAAGEPAQARAVGAFLSELWTRERSFPVRCQILRQLGAMEYAPALPLLRRMLSEPDKGLRSCAIDAVGFARDDGAGADLARLAGSETDELMVCHVAEAACRVKPVGPMAALRRRLPSVRNGRCCALQAIGCLGDQTDLPFVARFLDDPDPLVRGGAARAMSRLSGEDFLQKRQTAAAAPPPAAAGQGGAGRPSAARPLVTGAPAGQPSVGRPQTASAPGQGGEAKRRAVVLREGMARDPGEETDARKWWKARRGAQDSRRKP